ncbi:MAG: fibronectin type III domain-containing protein [Kofleriaceae bacterium]
MRSLSPSPSPRSWLRSSRALGAAALSLGLAAAAPQPAEAEQCRVVEVDLVPTARLQIVAWLEDAAGAYVDTIYITNATGLYGIGNRPGILEFNSGPAWPYGRRETVFPVWAHRHGQSFQAVVFQNSSATTERDLSHPYDQSSRENYFCRPLRSTEPGWDTGSCASAIYTDKGVLSPTQMSLYPPRSDLQGMRTERDNEAIDLFRQLNPFDGVSRATPAGGSPARLSWTIPPTVPAGSYVLWVEVSKEFDHNTTYSVAARPAPSGISYGDYGEPYRGQPSVLYRVPFTLSDVQTTAQTDAYAGYGDPDGLDGNLRTPDASITVDVPGSGASRLTLVAGGGYRVKVTARPELDDVAPSAPAEPMITKNESGELVITFEAPGDDGRLGQLTGYDVRIRANDPITEANFEDSTPVSAALEPDEPGQLQTLTITGLLPATKYYVAVRAYDDCRNTSPLMIVEAKTGDRKAGEVDACFVATAAYGSAMATQVSMLRRFRDSMLSSSVLGQLAVSAYYTFGPAVAGVVGESELLRSTARAALDPVVSRVGTLTR